MNKLFYAIVGVLSLISTTQAATLNGAGATFPYPIYSKWFDSYHTVKPQTQINYQSIGSGGGIRQITEKTVDFGASDGPMTNQQMFKIDGKILHIPTVIGAVVVAYNVQGIDKIKLSGPVIADIFLGKVTRWTDPAIVKLNPGVTLADAPITVVHRADGSGTTYCFVDYLSKVSAEWKSKVGLGTSVNWPVGLGGKGNEGVTGLIKQTPNSIGYVELIYAKQNDIRYASVINKAGEAVEPSIDAIVAAAADAVKTMPKDYRVSITDAPGKASYPISTFTWLLVYQKNPSGVGSEIKEFLKWMLKDGQGMATNLGYAPLPEEVKAMVSKTVETIQ